MNSERTMNILKEIQDALPAKFDNVTRVCGNPAIYRLLYLVVLHSHAVPEYYPAVLAIAKYGEIIFNEDDTISFGEKPIDYADIGCMKIKFRSHSDLAEGWNANFLVRERGQSIHMDYLD